MYECSPIYTSKLSLIHEYELSAYNAEYRTFSFGKAVVDQYTAGR